MNGHWHKFSEALDHSRRWYDIVSEEKSFVEKILTSGQRFYIPPLDLMKGKAYGDVQDLLHLPFDRVAILSQTMANDCGLPCDSLTLVMDCKHVEPVKGHEPWCIVFALAKHPLRKVWAPSSPIYILSKMRTSEGFLIGPSFVDTEVYRQIDARLTPEQLMTEIQPDINAVTDLCALLGLKNVESTRVSAPGSKVRRALGKKPLFDYHVLKVDGEVWDSHRGDGTSGQEYRSHLRRAHVRRLHDGRRVLVRASYVRGAIPGFVHKDYLVAAA